MVVHASPLARFVYRGRGPEAGGIPLAGNPSVEADRDDLVTMLLFAAFYVYALQRTYPPGS